MYSLVKVNQIVLMAMFLLSLSVVMSCTKKKEFREYTEITTQGRFGSTELSAGPVTGQEVNLLSQIQLSESLANGIRWQAPKSWREVKGDGVRLVSFRTRSDLEVTVIAFPGNVGGIRANLVRWLGQVRVNLDDNQLTAFINSLPVGETMQNGSVPGLSYILVDFETDEAIRQQNQSDTTLAVIFNFNDQMLFVKLSGKKEQVASDKEDFLKFVGTIQMQGA